MLGKRGLVLVLSVVFLLLLAAGIIATDCGYVNSDLTLANNVNSTGDCFVINSSDVTLDCAGYVINYSTAGVLGYGVNNSGGHDNITIKNCVLYEGNATTSNKYAIYFNNAGEGVIEDNNITTIGSYSHGIYLQSSSGCNLTSNIITTSGLEGRGIYFLSSSNNNLTSNNVTTSNSNSPGIHLTTSSSDNNLNSNTVSSPNDGVWIYSSSNNNQLTSNDITTTGSGRSAIYFESSSNNNLTSNNFTASNTAAYGVYFSNSDDNNLTNGEINATNNDVYVATNGNNILLNVTFNKSDIGFQSGNTGGINVEWYVDAYVNDSSGNALASANVTAYNVSDQKVDSKNTQATGWIPSHFELIEFWQNGSTTIYHTPHNITATKVSYTSDSEIINLTATESTTAYLTLTSTAPVPEFSDYTILLILIVVVGGFLIIRKRDSFSFPSS